MSIEASKDKTIRAGSNYDSGTHIGFYLFMGTGDCFNKTADKFLSPDQIKSIEVMILWMATQYVNSNNAGEQ